MVEALLRVFMVNGLLHVLRVDVPRLLPGSNLDTQSEQLIQARTTS
jgi:hypothetical protein